MSDICLMLSCSDWKPYFAGYIPSKGGGGGGYSSLAIGMFLRRSYFFIIVEKNSVKSPSKIILWQFNIGLNWGTYYKAGFETGF